MRHKGIECILNLTEKNQSLTHKDILQELKLVLIDLENHRMNDKLCSFGTIQKIVGIES